MPSYYELISDLYESTELKKFIATPVPPVPVLEPLDGIVSPLGVDDILLNKTRAFQIVENYGKAYDLYNINGHSIEMRYFMLDFSCFFLQDNLDVKIIAVRLWEKHKAFQKLNDRISTFINKTMTLDDVFNFFRDDAQYIKSYDETYYVDFGFYRFHFFPPEYDGQEPSSLTIESIMLVRQSK